VSSPKPIDEVGASFFAGAGLAALGSGCSRRGARSSVRAGFASGASLNAPGNAQTADLVGTPTRIGGIGSGSPYYDPAAWAPVREPRFGNTGRNSVRGPGWWNIDLGLFRRFPIGRTTLEARVEAFNLTNTPNFNNPDGNVNSPGFMTITSAAPDERQIRLGLRVSF